MEINGKYLAWGMIHFSFFCYLVFIDVGISIEASTPFFEVLGKLVVYFGLWVFFGWRFLVNFDKAFENKKRFKR